jgi:lysophospholipase L1-like esterase
MKVTPWKVFGFLVSVLGFLCMIVFIFPSNGIRITENLALYFPGPDEIFSLNSEQVVDVEELIKRRRDSTRLMRLLSTTDSLKAVRKFSAESPSRIHHPPGNQSALKQFYEALLNGEAKDQVLRVLHYGDSQIEMDRITSYLRQTLQQVFGGSGPGLQPALQVIPSYSVRQANGGEWIRYALWGEDSIRAKHRRYGIMLNYSTFNSSDAQINFKPGRDALEHSAQYERIRVLVGKNTEDLSVSLSVHGKSMGSKKVGAGTPFEILDWDLEKPATHITLTFSGGGNPEIYGIALDGSNGIAVDNLPMRGCSGTIFRQADSVLLKRALDSLDVRLIILEFGGNVMPVVHSQDVAERYGSNFGRQIRYLKNLRPEACILVVGIADMSTRVKGQLQTYPFLKEVRDALKNSALSEGAAYWDMYQSMGGDNSMPQWVKSGLAGSDYIHFTQAGAEKIAEMLSEAILNDYHEYRLTRFLSKTTGIHTAITN